MGPPPQAVGASTAGGSNGLVHQRVGDVLEDAYIPERDRQDPAQPAGGALLVVPQRLPHGVRLDGGRGGQPAAVERLLDDSQRALLEAAMPLRDAAGCTQSDGHRLTVVQRVSGGVLDSVAQRVPEIQQHALPLLPGVEFDDRQLHARGLPGQLALGMW